MGSNQMSDYEKELCHRLLAEDIPAWFIEEFYKRRREEGIEHDLREAADKGREHYEDMLWSWVESAKGDYYHYVLKSPGYIQEGDIPPKETPRKKRRTRKTTYITEPRDRQAALGQYLARVASENERIIDFRKNCLAGRALPEREALTFLSSPLAAAKPHNVFKMLRTPPLEHILDEGYQVRDAQDDSGPYRELVWERSHSHTIRPLGIAATKLIFPGDVVTEGDLRGLRLRGNSIVAFPHPREKRRFVVALPRSIIGDAVRLVEVSLGGFPISLEMGVWFILTDEFNPDYPVRLRYETTHRPYLLTRTTITLEVESWLPPEEVLEQYRHVQQQVLGGTPRSLKRRTVDLFEFVNQRKEMTWRQLFDAWNKAHPSQRFRDRSHLYTTYKRALETIASPPTLSKLSSAPPPLHRFPSAGRGT